MICSCVPTGVVRVHDVEAARKQQEIFAELKTINLLQSKVGAYGGLHQLPRGKMAHENRRRTRDVLVA